jgi:hypothetical protein
MTLIQILLGLLVIILVAGLASITANVKSVGMRVQSLEGTLRKEIEDLYLPRQSGIVEARRSSEASVSQVLAYGGEAQAMAEADAEAEYLSLWGLRFPSSHLPRDRSDSS